MRIAERVNITGRAGHVCRHIHQANSLRRLDATGLADLDLRIARVLQERRQPADFEFGAAIDQNVRIAQRNDETWTRVHEVRIFSWFRQNNEIDFVATDFACERAEIWKRG